MSKAKLILLYLLIAGYLSGCKLSTPKSTPELESIQILETIIVDSVTADFPVAFAALTKYGRQYLAYYNKQRNMTIATRNLNEQHWQYKVLPSRVGWDSHNRIEMAMDSERCLHVSGNMHNDTMVYFKTQQPEDINSFERVFPLVSVEDEIRCTYPSFIKDAKGGLFFSYRIGGSGNGITILNRYNEAQKAFERLSDDPLFDGLGEMSAYKSGPRLGPDGFFHIVWLWRDTPACETNHDLSYARSQDMIHWQAMDEKQISVPISPRERQFTVDPVPAGGGAINGNFRLFFNQNHQAMIAYLKYDESGYSQVYLASNHQCQWNTRKVSDWDYRWEFSGPGSITFEIRITKARVNARREILISYSHIREGDGELRIDGNTYDLIEDREVDLKAEHRYPGRLMDPFSEGEGMQVRWMNMDNGEESEESYQVLRWETLGKSRFYEPPEKSVAPSPLVLYKLKRTSP